MADYTTKAVVKGELGITDTADDTTIDAIITAVSQWIDRYCGRKFDIANPVQGQGTSIRTYTASESGVVYIDDAVEIVEVLTDDGTRAYATTMDTDTYEAAPYNSVSLGGTYTTIYAINGGVFPTGRRAVKVEARFGWTAVPLPIVRACVLMTMRLYKRKDAPFGVVGSSSAEMGQLLVIPKLDPDVAILLANYRLQWWVV